MGPIDKLRRLPRGDRSLLLQTVLWLCTARLALWFLPLRVVRRLEARVARPRSLRHAPQHSPERITWALSTARHVVPYATCLPQALAAEVLLARSGHLADLRIGVLKTEAGRLIAHAWVEAGGQVVVGALPDLPSYVPLPPLPRVTS